MAAITGLAISAISAGYGIYQGEQKKKEARDAMNNFNRQELENVFEDMPISTLGSDIAREEASRTTASLVQASRQAGSRGVFSSIPKIQAYNNEANRRNQLELDNKIDRRNELIANDNQRIQAMQENRDNQELAGIGQLMDVGEAQSMSGIRGLANTLISATNGIKPKNTNEFGIENSNSPLSGFGSSSYSRNSLDSIFSPTENSMSILNANQFSTLPRVSFTDPLYEKYKPNSYGL